MQAARWSCINGHHHIARFTGDSCIMARTCPVCGMPAIASVFHAWTIHGVLETTNEHQIRKHRAKQTRIIPKTIRDNHLRTRESNDANACAKSFSNVGTTGKRRRKDA